jgi:hypothetical protein
VSHRFVRRLRQPRPLAPGTRACCLVGLSRIRERGTERDEHQRRGPGHASRYGDEQHGQRHELRDRASASEEAQLETDFDFVDAIGKRRHRKGGRRRGTPLIAVSRSTQAMNSEERVEKTQSEISADLARDPTLNVRGVSACRSLDQHGGKAEKGEEKRRIAGACCERRDRRPACRHRQTARGLPSRTGEARRGALSSPGLPQRSGESAREERHRGMADRVHRRRGKKADEPSPFRRYSAKLVDVILEDRIPLSISSH